LELRSLSALKDAASCRQSPELEAVPYDDLLELLERRLIAILQDERLASLSQSTAIYPLFANAAIIHCYVFMHDTAKSLPLIQLVSNRMRDVLESVSLPFLNLQYPEMMLWILIMGGIVTSESPEPNWYAKQVAELCLTLGVHGGTQVASMLDEFIWSELYRSPMTAAFWNDVGKFQGSRGSYEVKRLVDHAVMAIFNVAPAITEH